MYFSSVPAAAPTQIIYPSAPAAVQLVGPEQKTPQSDVVQIRLPPARPSPGREDDWFPLFDRIREESVPLPLGIQSGTVTPRSTVQHGAQIHPPTPFPVSFLAVSPSGIRPDVMRKLPETEVKITEIVTRRETLIVSDSRRDETRLPAVEPKSIPAPLERQGGDVWSGVVRQKARVVLPGKRKQHRPLANYKVGNCSRV